jgi:hypothetical protein
MPTAHEVLGVSSTATEAEIRGRYLQLVREFPPDRAPERFAEIRAALDELRAPEVKLERCLFSLASTDSLEELRNELRARLRTAKLSTAALIALADAS